MEQKYIDLINRLIKSTEDNKIEWKKSSSDCQYKLELNAATFIIDLSWESEPHVISSYDLTMYNGDNITIPIASVNDFPYPNSDFTLLQKLYALAEESCKQESQTISKVMQELDNLDLPF